LVNKKNKNKSDEFEKILTKEMKNNKTIKDIINTIDPIEKKSWEKNTPKTAIDLIQYCLENKGLENLIDQLSKMK
jgi:hypothetical protein